MLQKRQITHSIGLITRLYSLAFLVPAVASFIYDAPDAGVRGISFPLHLPIFLLLSVGSALLGTWLISLAKVTSSDLGNREAYLSVGLGWILLCLLTALPFMVGGTLPNFIDAFFEAMSGLTTTGASVINDLESVAPSIHVWRTFTQFLGGMGIIVLSVAVLSRLTQGGLQMLQAEVPGLTVTRSAPRIARAMRSLWRVYLGLFAIVFTALLVELMTRHNFGFKQAVFEAMVHSFATVSTGGFSSHSASIAYFDDPILEAIIIFGMLAAGTNFALILTGKQRGLLKIFRDGELRLYAGLFVGITSTIVFFLVRSGHEWAQALREAPFVVGSMMTSTGFGTANYVTWPQVTQMLILFLMVGGAMAGSTSGGMKLVRILLLGKVIKTMMTRMVHPRAATSVRIQGKTVKEATLSSAAAFFITFIFLWIGGTFALLLADPSFGGIVSAASASLSALSNIGPGLGAVGPTQNFSDFSMLSKGIVASLMWIGRLEIFTALIIFLPETWRH